MNPLLSAEPQSQQTSSFGVVLIGHGTRDVQGTEEFAALAASLRERLSPQPITDCYLELREPDIPTGIRQLLEMGVRSIIAAPILLFAARHAREDIPAEIRRELNLYPEIKWLQTEPLGCHPQLLELAELRLAELLGSSAGEAPAEGSTQYLIVARGTSDAIARQDIEAFVDRRRASIEAHSRDCEVSLAYVAAAEPRLKDALAAAVAKKPGKIIVLPHVLFYGEVLGEIRNLAEQASQQSGIEVLVADHLAAGIQNQARGTDLLVSACEARIRAKF